jgi:hypothetical protein
MVVQERRAAWVSGGIGAAPGREWQGNSSTFEANGNGSPVAWWNKLRIPVILIIHSSRS